MSNKRLVMIGTGDISSFHLPALRKSGFSIVGCCSRNKSKNATNFANKFKIPKVYKNYRELADKKYEWDALLIAIPVQSTFTVLKDLIKLEKPILVEKPVSISSDELKSIDNNVDYVQVAYNRRFYSTVSYAKSFISNHSKCLIKMYLPDLIDFKMPKKEQNYLSVKENSVHGLDLVNYLLPNLELKNVIEYAQPLNSFGRIAFLETKDGHKCIIFFNWNAPSNFSIEIDCLPYKLDLKPFEKFFLYKGMEIIEPTQNYPIRQYIPKLIESGNVFSKNKEFKPGFLEQSKDFMNLVNGGKSDIAANISDAYNAVSLAERILNFKTN